MQNGMTGVPRKFQGKQSENKGDMEKKLNFILFFSVFFFFFQTGAATARIFFFFNTDWRGYGSEGIWNNAERMDLERLAKWI